MRKKRGRERKREGERDWGRESERDPGWGIGDNKERGDSYRKSGRHRWVKMDKNGYII